TSPGGDDARALFQDQLEPAFATVRQAAETILTINQDAMVQKSERARAVADRMNTLTIAVSLAALILGALGSMTLTSRLLQPLGWRARRGRRSGEGEFDSRVEVSGRDERAQLASSINAMATRLGEYRHSSLGELLLAQQASQAAIDSLPDPVVVFDIKG